MLLASLILPHSAQAAVFIVDRSDDDASATGCTAMPNDCSLRGAIIKANTTPGDDVITLPAGTYQLTLPGTNEAASADGNLDITSNITINGADQLTTIIDGNGAVTGENVLRIFGGFTVALNGLTIMGGDYGNGGGILTFADTTLTNVTVTGNTASSSGGGIATQGGPLTLITSSITNNTGGYGGGLYVVSGTVSISSGNFTGNIASGSGQGGAIWQVGGTTTIDGLSEIHENEAWAGGGVSVGGGTLTVENSQIYMNQAASVGGGVFVNTEGAVVLTNSTVNRNDSLGTGGGIRVLGTLEMNGGQVALNTADYDGGGISVGLNGVVDLFDVYVNENHTTADPSYGGGIANQGGQVALEGSTVTGNYVSGAVSSFSAGGGIYSSGGDLTLTDSSFLENAAIDSGGGVFFASGSLAVTNTVIRGNKLTGTYSAGGGLFIGDDATAIVTQVEVSQNSSEDVSGGIHSQGVLTLENATIGENTADFAAGMLSTGGAGDTTSITNSTIYGNTNATGSGVGGLAAYNDVTIRNTIIAGNDEDECLNSSGTAILSDGYNISSDATCGFGAAGDQPNTDPLLGPLGDHGGETWTHVPLPGSPAIDGGTNSGCPTADQRGVLRPIDGDRAGPAVCDIGAVEVQLRVYLPLITR